MSFYFGSGFFAKRLAGKYYLVSHDEILEVTIEGKKRESKWELSEDRERKLREKRKILVPRFSNPKIIQNPNKSSSILKAKNLLQKSKIFTESDIHKIE